MQNTLKIVHQVFKQFTLGLATGEWQPFVDILTEDELSGLRRKVREYTLVTLGRSRVAWYGMRRFVIYLEY